MTINNVVTSSVLALSLLFLSLSLLTGMVLSAPTLVGHPFEVHLSEWKTLLTGQRVSCSEEVLRSRFESWKTSTREARVQQSREEFDAIASSRGRSLIALNTTTSATEVNALLAFRSSIVTDPTGALANWTMEKNSSHCSTWKGVICDETGQVTRIELRDLGLNGSITPMIGDLVHLMFLNLSGSNLWGPIPSELIRCQNLSVLDLSHNSLDGELSPELFTLPKLELLWLPNNKISGPLPEVVENRCRSMTSIWIDNTEISGTVPSSLSRCQNLTVLSLANNHLNGSIPATLGELHQLQQLWLDSNSFTGHIPSQLGSLKKLQWLGLEANKLDGQIPPSLGTLSQLQVLNLRNNKLRGSIPPALGNCSSLIGLTLGYNELTGVIPEELGNLSSLTVLGLRNNRNLTGPVPGSLSKCSKLQVIFLGACNFTSIAPEIWSMKSLIELSLLNNSFSGEIPPELENLSQLEYLDLSNNDFTGDILKFLGNLSSIQVLDLSNNKLKDNAVALSTLSQCPKLEILSLGHNEISGSLQLDFSKWPGLKYFSVTDNKLTGGIPGSFGSINSSLVFMDFSRNIFTGGFPAQVDSTHLSYLRVLLFSHNQLEGEIPSWLGNLKRLQVLDLSHNKLTGSIPQNFGNLDGYKAVQPSGDESSTATATFTFNQSMILTTKGRNLIMEYFYILQGTTYMDLSSNALQGEMPLGITDLVALKYLILSNNKFEGGIWPAFQKLKALETLDLSQNNLSGPIPSMLPSSLSTFNVSLNNLTGAIPTGGQFDTFTDASSYLPGNPGLCGLIIRRPCVVDQLDPSEDNLDTELGITDYMSIPGFAIGAAAGFFIVVVASLSWAPASIFVFGAADKGKAKVNSGFGLFNPTEFGWY